MKIQAFRRTWDSDEIQRLVGAHTNYTWAGTVMECCFTIKEVTEFQQLMHWHVISAVKVLSDDCSSASKRQEF